MNLRTCAYFSYTEQCQIPHNSLCIIKMSDNEINMIEREDKRAYCKYGVKCYQTNLDHLKKYKHPVKRTRENEDDSSNDMKKLKQSVSPSRDSNLSASSSKNISPKLSDVENLDVISDGGNGDLDNLKMFIKTKFLVDMPPDYYEFWEFCKTLNKDSPELALKGIGLKLVGPFDVLAGKFIGKTFTENEFLRHWRYFYDPPEFQTVIAHIKTGYHIGYFRDDPSTPECFVAACDVDKGYVIKAVGDNLFTALKTYLDAVFKSGDPFAKISGNNILKSLTKNQGDKMNQFTYIKQREKRVVCKTFHRLGLVVPFDKNSELGYRELTESDAVLKRMLDKVDKAKSEELLDNALSNLTPVITMANIATDECDFGTGVELGIDLFCYGNKSLNNTILCLLSTGYSLLKRKDLFSILQAHLEDRKKGSELSIL